MSSQAAAFILLIIFIVSFLVFLVINLGKPRKPKVALPTVTDAIRKLGIQQSIIKQLPTQRIYDKDTKAAGELVLTWETLFFFRADKYLEILVSTIRSTASEHVKEGTNMVIIADSGTFRFYWDDERRQMPGIGANFSGGLGAGMAVSKSANPNVRECIQLIDDLRFGRLKRPS